LCEPVGCQGNACLIHKFGKEIIGKDKEKEDFKKALEKLRELEVSLNELMAENLRLAQAFALWYEEREESVGLFDCYTLKAMKELEIPVTECPFGGLTFYHCK
jgi:hypothetical protein